MINITLSLISAQQLMSFLFDLKFTAYRYIVRGCYFSANSFETKTHDIKVLSLWSYDILSEGENCVIVCPFRKFSKYMGYI